MKYVCILLIVLFFSPLKAQQITYQPFHEGTTMWLHEEIIPWVNGGGADYYYHRTIWSGDSLIDGELYTRVFRSFGLNPNNPMAYIGGIRQDIPTQKVYFLNTLGEEFDISISHFLEVGDSVEVTPAIEYAFFVNSGFGINSANWLIVLEKDSIQINPNEYRVQYRFASDFYPDHPGYLYSAVWGFEEFYDLGSGWFTICYKEEDSLILGGGNPFAPWYNTCFATVEEQYVNFSVSPNPSTGKFQLTGFEEKQLVYTVTDVYGNELITNATNPEIDLSLQPSGCYFVHFSDVDRKISSLKILKQ